MTSRNPENGQGSDGSHFQVAQTRMAESTEENEFIKPEMGLFGTELFKWRWCVFSRACPPVLWSESTRKWTRSRC
ncbi:unnamed protein product, partial [Mesorhabditis belari]|uniref:Uncharacterized protein n=1 Tax=Mesorhabditis belari TaxID=2138241 RepID=A0AAF3EXM2_9BILA